MKILSWNVNGIRAWSKKDGTLDFVSKQNPDVFCMQEIKIAKNDLAKLEKKKKVIDNYEFQYYNSAERKGYSGTALLCHKEPLSVDYGIGHELDNEGRVITAEFEDYYVVTVYTPNSKPDLSRVDVRYTSWDKDFLSHIKKLEKKKEVIVCGDLNVAHTEIDLENDKANRTTDTKPGSPGFTDKERERFDDILEAGFIDSFRTLHPRTVRYSWWSYRGGARARNVGWRIDYVLTSNKLKGSIKKAVIYDEIHGSDHCPVGADILV